MGSTIPAVTDALLALLDGLSWPGASPQIRDGEVEESRRESITVGDTLNGNFDQEWFTFTRTRQEMYDIQLRIQVSTPGLKVKPARDRAFALLSGLETALAADPVLGIAATTGQTVLVVALQQPIHEEAPFDEGCVCVIHTALRVRAEINPASGG